ncbi:MAG: Hsp20/alpha crystallin family protein [Candidatus Micrarchaeota archaeon]|nr:Hsp20/alpha crystallin family protein [Candidatus Micrarchaeota archaeon]
MPMNRLSQNHVEAAAHSLEPSVESFQTPTEVIVVAHLAGVVREEVRLEGGEKSLTIKIVGPANPEQIARMGYYSHEVVRLYGFSHTVNFPSAVDFSKAKATFKNGMLEVRMPKK